MNAPAEVPTLTRRQLSLLPDVQKARFEIYERVGMVKIVDQPTPKDQA